MSATRTPAPPAPPLWESSTAAGEPSTTVRLDIEGMHCASCVAKVEHELCEVPGVVDASVNLTTAEATVRYRP